jgi:hypothetical protein
MPLVLCLATAKPGSADDATDDPSRACDRAAQRAERVWHLPAGLLVAIGVVESGRSGLGTTLRRAWPWTINAAGQGLSLANKASAIAAVHAYQAAGVRTIDVGCFQVDLFFHPEAFANLDVAFDPEKNADAAARILTRSHISGGSWDGPIALYHSASPARGQQYLRRVAMILPLVSTRSTMNMQTDYVLFLSPPAGQIHDVSPWGVLPQTKASLPHVLGPQTLSGVVQWTAEPRPDLPVVLTPVRNGPSAELTESFK